MQNIEHVYMCVCVYGKYTAISQVLVQENISG
jgi:hypothetical protein